MTSRDAPSLSAAAILAGAHATYAPASLGAVTAIHPESAMGGLSVLIADAEHKFLLPLDDLQTLWSRLGEFLDRHRSAKQTLTPRWGAA